MSSLKYKKKNLFFHNLNLNNLAKKKTTPFYLYSFDQIQKNISNIKKAFHKSRPTICFATKSNSNLEILKLMKKNGLGIDVVSGGELKLALKSGCSKSKIVFSGVGKSTEELNHAIDKNILIINCESINEVEKIAILAAKKKKRVCLGIRINPDVKVFTNKKIATGQKGDKFGVSINDAKFILKKYYAHPYLNFIGLSVHIGSQIQSLKPFQQVLSFLTKILVSLKKSGYLMKWIDLGGGMSVPYSNNENTFKIKEYAKLVYQFKIKNNVNIILEPGRYLVSDGGVIISKVIYVKKSSDRSFIILDAGMNDLLRPALYDAYHEILPLIKNNSKFKKRIEFVGPICESSDKFGTYNNYPLLKDNDYICIKNCGAYGKVLSSNYNIRPLIEEIGYQKGKVKVLKKRQKFEQIL